MVDRSGIVKKRAIPNCSKVGRTADLPDVPFDFAQEDIGTLSQHFIFLSNE
jgi:hypothetical protein